MIRLALIFLLALQTEAVQLRTPASLSSPAASIGQTTGLPKGQLVERVVCVNNPDQSYALYLPSNYSPDRKWPILYAFDPGARGKVPVEHFSEAAEKYGWIVVGSNTSRNGPLPQSVDAWNAMSVDTHGRFAIDPERIYVTGLSGGARAAIGIVTLCHDCAAGVIACSAGFPVGVEPASSMHFAFFGTTGVDDFNFSEMRTLDKPLQKAGIKHHIQVFDGAHEWAPAPVATMAVEWMELQAVKAGKRNPDDGIIDRLWQRRLQQAKALEDAKKNYEAYQVYVDLADSFKGLLEVADVEKKVSQLRDSREVKDAISEEQQQIRKQDEIGRRISELIGTRERSSAESSSRDRGNTSDDLDAETRLQGMLAELRKQAGRTEDTGDRRVARRVLDGTFIGLIEQGTYLLQTQKRYDEAARTFKLATEVHPERARAFFYLAWAYAAKGNKKQALRALQTAMEKGFSDLPAITGNKAFDSVREDAQYRQIIQAMQTKH